MDKKNRRKQIEDLIDEENNSIYNDSFERYDY